MVTISSGISHQGSTRMPHGHLLLCLGIVAVIGTVLAGCATPLPPPPVMGGCPGSNTGPSVRFGSLNLTPTVGLVPVGSTVSKNLIVTSPPPLLQLDFGGPTFTDAFEICVVTNPPVRSTQLGVDVIGLLEDPSPSAGATGPVNYWQNLFAGLLLRPLQDNQTSATGVLKVDVPAQNLVSALTSPPPAGFSSGRMLFTIKLSDGTHQLDLTITCRIRGVC